MTPSTLFSKEYPFDIDKDIIHRQIFELITKSNFTDRHKHRLLCHFTIGVKIES